MSIPAATPAERVLPVRKKPLYADLSFQVVVGVAIAILLGYISPTTAAW